MDAYVATRNQGRRRIAAAVGSIWGLATYGILWEGTPVEVSRRFVESPLGTIALLPARIVIWAILRTESILGRTFDLSTNYAWIAPAAIAVGAGLAVAFAAFVAGAAKLRRDHSPL